MRCVVPTALVLTLALGGSAARADEARPHNAITTNPARFGILHFQIEYERVVADQWSVFGGPIGFFHAEWYPFAHADGVTAWGGGVDAGARWYFLGEALDGAYVGPLLSLYRGEVSHDDDTMLTGYVFSPGAQGGYSWLIDRWVLAAGLGLSYGFASEEAPDGSSKAEQLPHWGPWINFRLNAGIAF
jgi:hypothetical protein